MAKDHWAIRSLIKNGLRPAEPPPQARPFNLPPAPPGSDDALRYATAALRAECEELANTPEGGRNDQLNCAAWKLGRYVASGYIAEADVVEALTDAARRSGLPDAEISRTVQRSTRDGQRQPKHVAFNTADYRPGHVLDGPATTTNGHHEQEEAEADDEPTWKPYDVRAALAGTHDQPQPTLLERNDGEHLLYPARLHWFAGEPESGKSWVAQVAAAQVFANGGTVLYVDYESTLDDVADRMRAMGVTDDTMGDQLTYVRPQRSVLHRREWPEFRDILTHDYDLAVVDGVTEALVTEHLSSLDNDEVAEWVKRIPRAVADHTQAAVICIDHVVKAQDGRGRYALGAQHKLASVDGCSFVVEPVQPLGRGLKGSVTVRVAKDRPGSVRPRCTTYRMSDRTQLAASIVFDSTQDGHMAVTIHPPDSRVADHEPDGLLPTVLMEDVSRVIEDNPGISQVRLSKEIGRRKEDVRHAANLLIDRDRVRCVVRGNGKSHDYYSIRPYRRNDLDEDEDQ